MHNSKQLPQPGALLAAVARTVRETYGARRPLKLGRRGRQLLHVLAGIREHVAYGRELRAARRLNIADGDVLTRVKYAGDYLARSITLRTRRDCLRFHYRFLVRATSTAGAGNMWRRPTILWSREAGEGQALAVTMSRAVLAPMEGECQLCFTIGDHTLSTLTFSIVDGRDLSLPCRAALFVGGVQGSPGSREQIRIAARNNGEVSPVSMLLLTAETLAATLGIGHLIGVSAAEQATSCYAQDKIVFDYDRLWREIGAVHWREGFYVQRLGDAGCGDRSIAGSHRSRTRRRRLWKAAIRRDIEERLRRLL